MYYLVILSILIVCVFITIYLLKIKEDYKDYKILNMSGESEYKCGFCKSYGSLFDYKKEKSDRTHGVPNTCQKIF